MGTHLKKWGRNAVLGLLGITALGFATCVTYVPPGTQAVRQTRIHVAGLTGPAGYSKNPELGGRWHVAIPPFETLHQLPSEWQLLSFDRRFDQLRDRYARTVPAARIETPDTFHVDVDVSILYRIVDPVKTISKAGTGRLYQAAVIDKYVLPGLKRVFGKLQPEQFFEVDPATNQPIRINAEKEAAKQLTESMAPYGIEVKDVRIRFPLYVDQVQSRFEQKSIEDQRTLTNTAQATLEENRAKYESLKAQGEQAAIKREAEGTAYAAAIHGKIEGYEAEKHSAGDKLVSIAQAEAQRLENEAYQGKGAELLVGLAMAKNICNMDKIYVSACGDHAFNPLDLNKTTKMITGSGDKR